jgi:hypothetical protein
VKLTEYNCMRLTDGGFKKSITLAKNRQITHSTAPVEVLWQHYTMKGLRFATVPAAPNSESSGCADITITSIALVTESLLPKISLPYPALF